jgi:adenylate cyclase
LLLGRYDEALKLTAKSLARHPTWTPALRASAAANALSGNIDEARKSMVQLRQVDPLLRMSNLNEQIGYYRPKDIVRIAEGLRLAGLPE